MVHGQVEDDLSLSRRIAQLDECQPRLDIQVQFMIAILCFNFCYCGIACLLEIGGKILSMIRYCARGHDNNELHIICWSQ